MKRKGTPFSYLQFMAQSDPQSQIVKVLGKYTRLRAEGPNLYVPYYRFPTSS